MDRKILFITIVLFANAAFAYDVNSQRRLLRAVIHGNTLGVSVALSENAELNPKCPTEEICNPLVAAIQAGNFSMAKFLIKKGADVNLPHIHGNTPLIFAVLSHKSKMVDFLIENGADINKPNIMGVSPLIGAAAIGNVRYVRKFLENGGKPNLRFLSQLEGGQYVGYTTALIVAVKHANIAVVRELLEHGADPKLKDLYGKSAIDYANKREGDFIIKMIEESVPF